MAGWGALAAVFGGADGGAERGRGEARGSGAGGGALAAVCGGADGGAEWEEERSKAAGLVGELWPPSAEELMGAHIGEEERRHRARQRGLPERRLERRAATEKAGITGLGIGRSREEKVRVRCFWSSAGVDG
jgi:hypothetical protein